MSARQPPFGHPVRLANKGDGHFILPDDCWLDNYYNPLLDSHKDFMEKFGDNEVARVIVERDIQEADFYKKYKDYYSYGFYIAQKL